MNLNTELLRRRARHIYASPYVPDAINQANQRKWVRSVLSLGDIWVAHKSNHVQRKPEVTT